MPNVTYTWAAADRPVTGYVPTSLVSDNASGDTSTLVSAAHTEVASWSACSDYTTSAALTIVCDLGAVRGVSAWSAVARMTRQFTCAPRNLQGSVCARCALVAESLVQYGLSGHFAVEYQNAPGEWTEAASGTLGTEGIWETHGGGTTFSTRYLRLVLTGAFIDRDANGNSNTVTLDVSDFRVAADVTPPYVPPPCVPPVAPLHVFAAPDRYTRSTLVSWDEVTGAKGYIVRRDGTVASRGTRLQWRDAWESAAGTGGVFPRTPAHVFSVCAVNACGEGAEAFAAGVENA